MSVRLLLIYRVPTLVGNLGNSWEFDLSHSQPGIGWECIEFLQSGWESTINVFGQENDQQNNFRIFGEKMEKSWEFYYGWEMVGDEDQESWEMVGNLLISKVWEHYTYGHRVRVINREIGINPNMGTSPGK